MRGTGAGGQHKNKTSSCVRAVHLPTGISVVIDGRHQHQNKKRAIEELENKIKQKILDEKTLQKKKMRDEKIKNKKYIRTYDYKTGIVTDHRTGKVASIKEVLLKGNLELLRDL